MKVTALDLLKGFIESTEEKVIQVSPILMTIMDGEFRDGDGIDLISTGRNTKAAGRLLMYMDVYFCETDEDYKNLIENK